LNVALSILLACGLSFSKPFDGLGAHLLVPDQGDNPLQVDNRGEFDDDLAFGSPQLDFYSSLEVVGEPISEILGLRRNDLGLMPLPCSLFPMITESYQLLDGTNG
jgi:hypothetical protein